MLGRVEPTTGHGTSPQPTNFWILQCPFPISFLGHTLPRTTKRLFPAYGVYKMLGLVMRCRMSFMSPYLSEGSGRNESARPFHRRRSYSSMFLCVHKTGSIASSIDGSPVNFPEMRFFLHNSILVISAPAVDIKCRVTADVEANNTGKLTEGGTVTVWTHPLRCAVHRHCRVLAKTSSEKRPEKAYAVPSQKQ